MGGLAWNRARRLGGRNWVIVCVEVGEREKEYF